MNDDKPKRVFTLPSKIADQLVAIDADGNPLSLREAAKTLKKPEKEGCPPESGNGL